MSAPDPKAVIDGALESAKGAPDPRGATIGINAEGIAFNLTDTQATACEGKLAVGAEYVHVSFDKQQHGQEGARIVAVVRRHDLAEPSEKRGARKRALKAMAKREAKGGQP